MKGTPENTVILHWDECRTAWTKLPWRDWVRFRGFGGGELSMLAGAEAGDHYFLVCVLGDRGVCAAKADDARRREDGALVKVDAVRARVDLRALRAERARRAGVERSAQNEKASESAGLRS